MNTVQHAPGTDARVTPDPAPADTRTDIVVGYDASAAADAALDWAAHEAERRGVRLRILSANPYAGVEWSGLHGPALPPVDPSDYVGSVAAKGAERAAHVLDGELVDKVPVTSGPVSTLVKESGTAALLVLGHRARGRLNEIITGSVVSAVTTHADCDVVVVPPGALLLPGPRRPVVVGVDGGPDGDVAARRAAEYAVRWDAPLEIVQAWRSSNVVGWPEGLVAGDDGLIDELDYFERRAEESVARVADAVRALYPRLTVRTIVIEEHPATALADISATAGLLVVGSRGLGGFERLMLGSTSRAVLHHATVPVVVARG